MRTQMAQMDQLMSGMMSDPFGFGFGGLGIGGYGAMPQNPRQQMIAGGSGGQGGNGQVSFYKYNYNKHCM